MKPYNHRPATFVFATVMLLMAAPSAPLRAQAVPEPRAGAQLAVPAGSVDGPGNTGLSRSAQPYVVSHRFTLFQGDAPAADFQVNTLLNEAVARDRRSHTLAGAAAGLVIGAGATYLLLQQGGSRSFCNRDTNQDAIHARGCHGLYAAGGAIGAGVGALIGYRIGR
jgi:hypothetical protein